MPIRRRRRGERLERYAARMRAGLTPATLHRRLLYTPEQRELIAQGVPESFFLAPVKGKTK